MFYRAANRQAHYDRSNSKPTGLRGMLIKLQRSIYYLFGYGLPMLIVVIVIIVSNMSDVNHYIKKVEDEDGIPRPILCWLDNTALEVSLFVAPVCLMMLFNLCVVIVTSTVATLDASHAWHG